MRFTISMNHAQNANLRLFNSLNIKKLYAAFAEGTPSDFKLVVHDNLEYKKKDGTTMLLWGLVPFYNGSEHSELAITQFDLLIEDELQYSSKGELLPEGFTPNDSLHKMARESATPTTTYKEWLDNLSSKFQGDKFKISLHTYYAKTLKGALYMRYVWGVTEK